MARRWRLSSGKSVEYKASMVMDLQGEREKWVTIRKTEWEEIRKVKKREGSWQLKMGLEKRVGREKREKERKERKTKKKEEKKRGKNKKGKGSVVAHMWEKKGEKQGRNKKRKRKEEKNKVKIK